MSVEPIIVNDDSSSLHKLFKIDKVGEFHIAKYADYIYGIEVPVDTDLIISGTYKFALRAGFNPFCCNMGCFPFCNFKSDVVCSFICSFRCNDELNPMSQIDSAITYVTDAKSKHFVVSDGTIRPMTKEELMTKSNTW